MKDVKDVNLYKLQSGNEVSVLSMIESDSDLKDTFGGQRETQSRILNSVYTALIRNKKTPVGFIMLVHNGRTNKFEIDMGILKQYRGKGFGTRALDLLKDIILYNKLNVEVQTEKTNKAAIKSVIKNGFVLCKTDEIYNYYVLKEDSKHIK